MLVQMAGAVLWVWLNNQGVWGAVFQCKARVWSDNHRLRSEETKSSGRASFLFSMKICARE